MLIKNGMIHTAVDPEPFEADILVENGKIANIGNNLSAEGEAEVYDIKGHDVYPGFIDPHTHIGMFGYSGGPSKDDVEEFDRWTPQHRGIDCIYPLEDTFRKAVRAGVTCICDGPGSVNCIAGTHLAMKTYGRRIDDMVVKDPVAMKIAFGENPKKHLRDHITTRMSIAACIRDALYMTKEYKARKEAACGDISRMPAYNPKLEALIPVIEKKIPLKAHSHRCDDTFTAIRIAKELDCDLTLEHVTEGGLIADELAKEGYPIAFGPYLYQAQKNENARKTAADGVKLFRAGCKISVMTDSPIVAEEYLPILAGILMREGLTPYEALQTITINAAKHLRIEDRVGSLEVGKDADIVVADGNPLEMCVKPEMVFCSGKLFTE